MQEQKGLRAFIAAKLTTKQSVQKEKRAHVRPRLRHRVRSYRDKRPCSIKTSKLELFRRHERDEAWIESGIQAVVPYRELECGRAVENEGKIMRFVESGYISKHQCIGPAGGRSPFDMLSDAQLDTAIQISHMFKK